MNSSRFFIVQILLFCSHYVANVQSQEKGLALDLTKDQLIEIDENHETAQCARCITACAASPDSKEEQQIEKDASIDERAIFLQEVYENEDETKKIDTDSCKNPLSPAIIWHDLMNEFQIGFEMFYDEKKIKLVDWFSENHYKNYYGKVIEDGQITEYIERTTNEFIKTYYDQGYLTFELLFGSKQILKHYFIMAFAAKIYPDQKRRIITYKKDIINDFFHQTPSISRCENYFLEGASKADELQLQSLLKRDKEDTSTEEQVDQKTTAQHPIENRLIETQILPMQMFHTYSARLATCMYINIAYIWNTVANGPLNQVDLFLYSMYRLWPEQLQIQYAVQDEIKIDSVAIASENQLFHRYPVPEIIFRIVEWVHDAYEYKAVVVIHNNPNPVKDEDRICSDPIKSWNVMNEAADTAIGQSYACPYSTDVISKLQLDERTPETALDLDNFPQIVVSPNTSIHHANVTQKIRDELNRHKKQQ